MNDQYNTTDLDDQQPESLSLMGGVAKPQGLPEAAELDLDALTASRRKISQGTLIILLVVVIAAGSLYAMRLGQGDLSAGGVSAEVMKKIETALARANPTNGASVHIVAMRSAFRDTDSIVNMFNTDVTRHQIPLEYVQKNPFALPTLQVVKTNSASAGTADAARLREHQAKLKAQSQKLELQSVMANGRIPVVVIDGQFYKTGQQVGPFTITRIHDRGVDLEADGLKFSLSMQDQMDTQRRGRR